MKGAGATIDKYDYYFVMTITVQLVILAGIKVGELV